MSRGLTDRTATGTATVVAALTCLPGLGHQPLSWDEAVTLAAAEHRPGRLLALLRHTDAPLGLYYLGMHAWIAVLHQVGAPPTAGWLRLPSAVAAILAVALTASIAGHWFGPRVGLLAGVLLAVHPLFVFYADDARPYTLATLLVLATAVGLVRALRRPTPLRLGLYTGTVVATAYTHLFAILALAGQFVVAARRPGRARWAVGWVVAAGAVAPLAYLGTRQSHEIGWIPQPSLSAVASVLLKVAGSGVVGAALIGVLLCAPPVRAIRTDERVRLLVAWALVPPLALVVADLVTPVLVARYALVAVPALVTVVALSAVDGRDRVGVRRQRLIAGCALLAVLGGVVTSAVQQSRPYKYEDYRAAADLVDDNARPGDAIVFVPAANRVGYDDYAGARAGREVADVALRAGAGPAQADQIPGLEVDTRTATARMRACARVFLFGVDARGVVHGGDRVKVAVLRAGYRRAWSRGYGDVTVTLFSRGPAGGVRTAPPTG